MFVRSALTAIWRWTSVARRTISTRCTDARLIDDVTHHNHVDGAIVLSICCTARNTDKARCVVRHGSERIFVHVGLNQAKVSRPTLSSFVWIEREQIRRRIGRAEFFATAVKIRQTAQTDAAHVVWPLNAGRKLDFLPRAVWLAHLRNFAQMRWLAVHRFA